MSPRRLILALAITTAAAWRFPGLARPREEDVIEHEVTPTGPRELTIETHDYEAHESTMVLPCVKIKFYGAFVLSTRLTVDFHTGSRTRLQEARVRVLEGQDHGRLVRFIIVRFYA